MTQPETKTCGNIAKLGPDNLVFFYLFVVQHSSHFSLPVEHIGLPVPQPRQAGASAGVGRGRLPRGAQPRRAAAARQAVDVSLHQAQ